MVKAKNTERSEGEIRIVTDLEAARHAIPGHSNFATLNVNQMECIIDFWYSDISVARVDFDNGENESIARLVARIAMPTNKAAVFFNEGLKVIDSHIKKIQAMAAEEEAGKKK